MRIEDADELYVEIAQRCRPKRERGVMLSNYASYLWKLFSCPRRFYYDRTMEIEDSMDWFDASEHGNIIGALMVDRFKRAGLWRGDEVRGGDVLFNVSYRIDILMEENGETVPVEVKSVYAQKWNYMNLDDGPPNERHAHVLQLQTYLHFHKPSPYPYGYLLYYNRNNDKVRMFRVYHDPELGKEIEHKLLGMEVALECGHLPARGEELNPQDEGKNECRYCEHRETCIGEEV